MVIRGATNAYKRGRVASRQLALAFSLAASGSFLYAGRGDKERMPSFVLLD